VGEARARELKERRIAAFGKVDDNIGSVLTSPIPVPDIFDVRRYKVLRASCLANVKILACRYVSVTATRWTTTLMRQK
jgi:hypothetical protein